MREFRRSSKFPGNSVRSILICSIVYLQSQSQLDVELRDMKSMPAAAQAGRQIDFNHLMASLRSEREIEFLQGIHFLAEKNQNQLPTIFKAIDNDETLLIAACKRGLAIAVERMLRLDADINAVIDTARGQITPIETACEYGNWKVLELLLRAPKFDANKCGPLLSIVVRHIGEKVTEKCDYDKCFEILLDSKNVEINRLDANDCSALHYATKFNNSDVILELLKRGAYIGQRNTFDQYPISNMNPELLEKHFDNCISTNGLRDGEDDFQIDFDYTNLVPSALRTKNIKRTNSEFKKTFNACPNEMIIIEMISETNELRHLIRHPLIASFLFLKWNQLALIFYMNFLLCFLFAITTSVFILTCYNQEPEIIEIKQILRIVTFILTLYIIVREISQFRLSPGMYVRSVENYMECAMIVLVIIVLLDLFFDRVRRTVAATSLLLIGIELFHLAGSLPFFSFSTHYVMLKTVISSFLKSLSLYAILLLSFALAFFTLLREKPIWVRYNVGSDEVGDEDLNKFSNLGLSIMKTLVMSTGEFDAADIHFGMNAWSYFVFISFLFVISTVMFNLLNGLAVNDIQTIKSEAELMNFIHRCQVLARYENALVDNRLSLR